MTTNLRTLLREGFNSPDKWYALNTTDGWSAELMIYDVIGWWPNDAETLARELRDLEVDQIQVRINSPGGSAFDGFAIYNALRSHPAKVTTVVEGLAASAASIIALAGDEVVMRPASELMVHEAWTAAAGPAEDMRKVADELDRINGIIAGIYAEKAGTPVDMWREAMRVETWFSPDEAVESGLVDAVHSGRSADVANVSSLPIFNYSGRSWAPAPCVSSAEAERGGGMPTIQEQLRLLVGISDEDADDEVIVAAITEALDERAEDEDSSVSLTAAQFTKLAEAVGMTSDDDPGKVVDEAVDRIESADGGAENLGDSDVVMVDRGRFEELATAESELVGYREKEIRAEAEALVDAAIADDRLAEASKDRWVQKILDDPQDAKPRLASIKSARLPRVEMGRGEQESDWADSASAAAHSSLDAKAAKSGFDLTVKP